MEKSCGEDVKQCSEGQNSEMWGWGRERDRYEVEVTMCGWLPFENAVPTF